MSKHNLTVKQKAFADHYIKTGNATQSYKDAGYKWTSDNVAASNAYQLLEIQKVKAYIERRSAKIDKKILEEQINVRNELNNRIRQVSGIDFGNNVVRHKTYTDIEDDGKEVRVTEETIPVRPSDLTRMLELLAKVDGTLTGDNEQSNSFTIINANGMTDHEEE